MDYIIFKKIVPLFFIFQSISCLEEPSPEIYLQPRNFNPHPYIHGATNIRKNAHLERGPVLFPINPEDATEGNNNGFVSITENSVSPENHPYAKVARKHRYRVPGRFNNEEENEVGSEVYDALAEHGAKVLAYRPEDLKHIGSKTNGKNYAFAYKVLDHLTGDDFSHAEERNSKSTSGEYRVKLPDGRTQIVSYTADKNGYKADVKYEPDQTDRDTSHIPGQQLTPQQPVSLYDRGAVEVQRVPVRRLTSPRPQRIYDYDYYEGRGEQQIVSPIVVLPTIAPNYVDVQNNRQYKPVAVNNFVQPNSNANQHIPSVEIITTNARDYSTGSYLPSTVSPNFKTIEHYQRQQNVVVPTTIRPQPHPVVINNGNHGLFSPQPTAATLVLTDRHGNVINNVKIIPTTVTPLILLNDNGGERKNSVIPTTTEPFIINVVGPSGEDRDYKKKK